jgi:hypothetical protein
MGLRDTKANDRLDPPLIKPNGRFSRIGFPRAFDSHRLYAGTCFHAAQVGQLMQAVACSQSFPGVRCAHGLGGFRSCATGSVATASTHIGSSGRTLACCARNVLPTPASQQPVDFHDDLCHGQPVRGAMSFSLSFCWLLAWGSICESCRPPRPRRQITSKPRTPNPPDFHSLCVLHFELGAFPGPAAVP